MRIVLAGMALVGLVSAAIAADLPATQPQARRTPAFTWSGFYAGAHGGYSWSDTDARVGANCCTLFPADIANGVFPTSIRAQQDGPLGGGQVGYNLQIGRLIAGIEADASWMGARSTASHSAPDPALGGAITNTSLQTGLDWLATVRGRAGLTFGRALLFATGGVAFGEVENRTTVGMPNPPAFFPPTHTPYAPAPWLKRDT
jgi:outer membrane immunogenic protein